MQLQGTTMHRALVLLLVLVLVGLLYKPPCLQQALELQQQLPNRQQVQGFSSLVMPHISSPGLLRCWATAAVAAAAAATSS